MNILYHHRTQGKGVEGVHINEIVKALNSLGHQVDIVSPETKPNSAHSFISKFLPEIFFEALEIFYNFVAAKKMDRLLAEKRYDFIYERYAIFNWAGVRTAKKYKIPIILEINYTSFTPIYRKRSVFLKPSAHWLDKKIFREANGLIVVSNYLKDHLIDMGVDEKKVIVLTNAADPVKFNPAIEGCEVRAKYGLGDSKVIGFIGGFYPWHGLDMLIDSFLTIKKENIRAHLMLIGDGPIKDKLTNKVKKLNIDNDVLFLGRVEHDKLAEYIAAFDIAVMPDSNNYGSPMKIYEYMAMGKPVIAPHLGPLEDGIVDGREGILFDQRDKNGLYNALKMLLLNDKLRISMGHLSRENIMSRHTWLKNAEAILKLYHDLDAKKNRILFITPRMPYPPLKGDRLRPYNFIKELSKRHTIDLCTFYEGNDDAKGLDEMKKYCANVETVPLSKTQSYMNLLRSLVNFKPLQVNYYYSKAMKRKVEELEVINKYDIIHVVLQRMMPYAIRRNGEKLVLDQIDALSLNMKRRALTEKNLIKKAIFYCEYINMASYERHNKQKYNECIITSDVDKRALGDDRVKVISNGVDTAYFAPAKADKNIDLIFTGNMNYFPNVDGVVYFCEEIMPKILKVRPDVKFYIVGVNPNKEVISLADNKNIFVTGFVDDIREYLNRAKIFVAPLRSGSGIQNKILEAMACGLPVVSTSQGNSGIKAEDGKDIVLADDIEELAKTIIDLLSADNKRTRIGDSARNMVEKNFSWSSNAQKLELIYGV